MDLNGFHVAIAGGGIAGLALAVALRGAGAGVSLFERAPAITEVGAGIQVSPNGARVLEAMGLGAGFAEISVPAQAVSLRVDATGSEVLRLDLARYGGQPGYRFVHRHDLAMLLHQAALTAGAEVHTGADVTGAAEGLTLGSGQHVPADLVVGADGLHSVLRAQVNGPSKPFFTGQVAWRATVPNDMGHPDEARVHMGPGRHLVSYPLRDRSVVNVVGVQERSDWAEEGWAHEDDPAALRAAFAGAGRSVFDLLDRVERVGLWGLFRHPVADAWTRPGVALVGDAAHPTLPFLAQGANMALEDIWILTRCLTELPDLPTALSRYQAVRRPRCARIVQAATGNARKYHLRPGPVRFVAHTGLRMIGAAAPGAMLRSFDWLYGYDATRIALE